MSLELRRSRRETDDDCLRGSSATFDAQIWQPRFRTLHRSHGALGPDARPAAGSPRRQSGAFAANRVTDEPLLLDGFARLSAESRQARFLIRKDELTEAEVRYFTDVDHHDHEAIIALSAVDGRGVGVARFVRAVDDDQAAEVAVTVVDDWQRRGLGALLLRQLLERALPEGIRRFTAMIDDSNTAMLGLLRSLGIQPRVIDREFGATEYSIKIDEAHEPSTLARPHVRPA